MAKKSGSKSLMVKGKGDNFATFNVPVYGTKFNTQGQADFNSYPKPKKVNNGYTPVKKSSKKSY